MSRWQDRGEVLDSDDEDRGLDEESQSPHYSKRLRLDDGRQSGIHLDAYGLGRPQSSGRAISAVEDGEEVDWIKPPVANTYSRKGTLKLSTPSARSQSLGVEDGLASASEFDSTAGPSKRAAATAHTNVDSSQPSSTSELPDVDQILAERWQSRTPIVQDDSPLSSLLSSPPSVRGQEPSQAKAQSRRNEDAFVSSSSEALQRIITEIVDDELPSRRTFRPRKQKQLHPYEFDKLQYQKQLRERGLRPIRVAETQEDVREECTASPVEQGSPDDSDSCSSPSSPSSPARGQAAKASSAAEFSLTGAVIQQSTRLAAAEELPDLYDLLQATGGNVHKRRKLMHHRGGHAEQTPSATNTARIEQDEFSIPPSPPLTSRPSTLANTISRAPSGFRVPRGLTPVPLPTPNVSSGNDRATSGILPWPSQTTPSAGGEKMYTAATSLSSSSESESEQEVDERRLRREKKNIKGVLPASWLKIDLRAQQRRTSPLPTEDRQGSLTPEPGRNGQKGVAQKLSNHSATGRGLPASLSDSSDDNGDDPRNAGQSPLPESGRPRSSVLPARQSTATALTEWHDDEDMEFDSIDPMFAGRLSRNHRHCDRKRQPKIKEALKKAARSMCEFAEDGKGVHSTPMLHSGRSEPSLHRAREKKRQRSSETPRLSIVDVAGEAGALDACQFLRVARRTAKKRPDAGRHSPKQKILRLATRDDTEEASATLYAWRQGSILPRRSSSHETERLLQVDGFERHLSAQSRAPLADISHNSQRRLPEPEQAHFHADKQDDVLGRRPRRSGVRQLRSRQTRLRPILVELESTDALPVNATTAQPNESPRKVSNRRVPRADVQYREAQLESVEDNYNAQNRAAAFASRMRLLAERAAYTSRISSLHRSSIGLSKNLHRAGPNSDNTHKGQHLERRMPGMGTTILPQRRRKHMPQRLEIETRDYRQPSEPLPETVDARDSIDDVAAGQEAPAVLQGLGRFGTKYATDFDVLPLSMGTYFRQDSFIGSGDFEAVLNTARRDFESTTGRIRICINGRDVDWGVWNEDVSAELSSILAAIEAFLTAVEDEAGPRPLVVDPAVLKNVDYLLRSTARYFARCLAFLDPIDRRVCVFRLHQFVQRLLDICIEQHNRLAHDTNIIICCAQFGTVLAHQALSLSEHSMIQDEVKEACVSTLGRATRMLARQLFPTRVHELRRFLEDNRRPSLREAGIPDGATAPSATVILRYVQEGNKHYKMSFWSTIDDVTDTNISKLCKVQQFDALWGQTFAVLPLLEIDAGGVARLGSRMYETLEDWTTIKLFLNRLFELYRATSLQHGVNVSDYVRATMVRCFLLTSRWGWRKCEGVLGTLFDFFAHRGLSPLHKEEEHGSPAFLDVLESQPSFEPLPGECSYHIFLKYLATALRGMYKHGVYTEKKMANIAYRFIPNHGHMYRKDEEVRRDDLVKLRNHHDLLCVLYFATPATARLRINVFRNLVDHSASHIEACKLNIRAWANVAAFQASTTEGAGALDPIMEWYEAMLSNAITQYRLARTEVERDAATANAQGQVLVASIVVEDTIARNQRQIGSVLVDALAALKRALRASTQLRQAVILVERSIFWRTFELFEASSWRLCNVLDEALEVAKAILQLNAKFAANVDSQSTSEESQEFGDSSALQALASDQAQAGQLDGAMLSALHGPLAQLVSNVLGADHSLDDLIVMKVIDVWVDTAQSMVRSGSRTWSNYISGYSTEAWSQLRETHQLRKFTPYFLSCIVDRSAVDLQETGILKFWLASIVEREALLKYQHRLTSSLLNRYAGEPLLGNLPFVRPASGRLEISLNDFRHRRLSVVSMVLCNIQDLFHSAIYERSSQVQQLRSVYADLLKSLMQAMKSNYQDLQASGHSDVAQADAQGAYVDFVHSVVSYMQQYTVDVCQIDRFFTDSSAFPLPSADPAYVVGRLRAYVPKLAEPRRRKELTVLLYTVSERAAVDNQQRYLVDQLVRATTGSIERGNSSFPSLRHVLLTAVFPAYIQSTLTSECSWILARPILQACGSIAEDLLYTVLQNNEKSVESAIDILAAVMASLAWPLERALMHPALLQLPHSQAIVAECCEAARRCLTCVGHLSTPTLDSARTAVKRLYGLVLHVDSALNCGEDNSILEADHQPAGSRPCIWQDTLDFSRKNLQEKLTNEWYAVDGQFFVKRKPNAVEVTVRLREEDGERQNLMQCFKSFRKHYERVFDGTHIEEGGRRDGLIDELIV